jgi:ribonuclease P protein component
VGFSVPKKKFRKSVERHRVRRLMAEAWRLNKQNIYPAIPADKQLHLFIIYTDNVLPAQQLITEAIVKGMEQFSKILSPRP